MCFAERGSQRIPCGIDLAELTRWVVSKALGYSLGSIYIARSVIGEKKNLVQTPAFFHPDLIGWMN